MPKYGENIYHRKDGRWEARYIAMRLPNGKAKYKSVYGRTHDIAKKKQLAAMQALTHESAAVCELTLKELFSQYLLQTDVKLSTKERYRFMLDAEDEPFVRQFAAAYAARDRMGMLRVLLPMEKYKREQLLPLLQQLRACFCSALAQRGGFDAADQSAAQLVASRSGTELVQAADSLQTAIDDLAANASAGAVIGYLAMKLR